MAVGTLSMRWIQAVLADEFAHGALVRELLDFFSARLVTARSTPGAKARVAKRLYSHLDKMARKGVVSLVDGRVGLCVHQAKPASPDAPLLTAPLLRLLFTALLAQDRNVGGRLEAAQRAFALAALDAQWSAAQIALELGVSPATLKLLSQDSGKLI